MLAEATGKAVFWAPAFGTKKVQVMSFSGDNAIPGDDATAGGNAWW